MTGERATARMRLLNKFLRTSKNLVAAPLKAARTLDNGQAFDHLIVGRELGFEPSTMEEVDQFVGISFSRGLTDDGICNYHLSVMLDKNGKVELLIEENATRIGDTEDRVLSTYRPDDSERWTFDSKVDGFDDYLELLKDVREIFPLPKRHRLRMEVQLEMRVEGNAGPH